MLLAVELIRNKRNQLAIPELAIVGLAERRYVFVVSKGDQGLQVKTRDVVVGVRDDSVAEILDGLDAGERVVVNGVHRLREGAAIKIGDDTARGTMPRGKGQPSKGGRMPQ